MSTPSKVTNLADFRNERDARAKFMDLIDADIKGNPERVQPLPQSLFDDISSLRARAEKNRRSELLEG